MNPYDIDYDRLIDADTFASPFGVEALFEQYDAAPHDRQTPDATSYEAAANDAMYENLYPALA